MEGSFLYHLVTRMFILLQLIAYMNPCLAIAPTNANTGYIKYSCASTLYPQLCFKSLSIFADIVHKSPRRLVQIALAVTLSATRSTPSALRKLAKSHAMKHKVATAMIDCFEEVEDSVDELTDSFQEMAHMNRSNFLLQINDVQTWVSAALTDDYTCTDGFAGRDMDGEVKVEVRRIVLRIAHLTSNALALINKYAQQHLLH